MSRLRKFFNVKWLFSKINNVEEEKFMEELLLDASKVLWHRDRIEQWRAGGKDCPYHY